MSRILDDKSQTAHGGFKRHHPGVYDKVDLEHYHLANRAIEDNRHRIEDTEKEIAGAETYRGRGAFPKADRTAAETPDQ